MSVKRRFIDADHGQLHLRVAGHSSLNERSKPAIICLHMVPKSGRSFANLLPELASERVAIAPDYPGYGESDPFSTIAEPSIDDYATSIHQLIGAYELNKIDLVGYHTGSMVAVAIAHRYPGLVRKVVNISAPIFTDAELAEFHQHYAPVPLDEAGTRFSTMWQRIMYHRGPGMTLEMAANSLAENLRAGERYEDGHRAAFNFSKRYVTLLEVIKQPVWVMNLADDLSEHTRRASDHLNNGFVTEFPAWGHGCLDRWPAEIAQEILGFLDS